MEWSPAHSTGYYVALALGLSALLLLARRLADAPTARSVVLLGLRAAALAVLLVILLDPVRVREARRPPQRPSAVLLFDESRSMGLERPVSRLDRARALLGQAEARLPADERP